MGKESSIILIDLPGTDNTYNNEDTYAEWTIETQIDRVLFLTLSTTDGSPLVDKQLQSLTVILINIRKYTISHTNHYNSYFNNIVVRC